MIETAKTYYDNRDRLIYTYRGNVFMRGGELYDPQNDGRGRIDCSSLVHLALIGLPYEQSPYVTGDVDDFFSKPCHWYAADSQISDESEALGDERSSDSVLSIGEVFAANSERGSDVRRSYGLAKYCRENGLEIQPGPNGSYEGLLKPGDLVFFKAAPSRIDEYIYYKIWLQIAHVGIVLDDTDYMINATGSSKHELNAKRDSIQYTKISDKGTPVLAARFI